MEVGHNNSLHEVQRVHMPTQGWEGGGLGGGGGGGGGRGGGASKIKVNPYGTAI